MSHVCLQAGKTAVITGGALATNLWGVIHGTQVFVPNMVKRGHAGLVINTGSKQGITTPPGNPAYNVAKAGVKAYTEALQHQLRNMPGCRIARRYRAGILIIRRLSRRSSQTAESAGTMQRAELVARRIPQVRKVQT